MKNKKIYLIISVSVLTILLISLSVTFAWFLPKANSSIIKSGDIAINITGYVNQTEGEDNTNCAEYPKKLSDENVDLNFEFFDNTLTFAFVIENVSDINVNVELRLSDFSRYIFEGYANEISDDLKAEASKYNSKFFLYFDNAKVVKGNDIIEGDDITFNDSEGENKEITAPDFECNDLTPFLWKYAYNNTFFSVEVGANETVTAYISLKNSQSSISIKNDYLNWLYSYGKNYLMDIKGVTDETAINDYILKYYTEEVSTLLSDENDMIIPDTTFILDYFEFVANSMPKD